MSTIYRDYRPNSFSEILGQNHIKITLENEILSGHLGHAYLFCGPRAVGKTTTARILAKALNCKNRGNKSFEPCNKCESCESIKKGNDLDVLEIDAASNTGVDNVRENIISFSRLVPNGGKYKVFIIDEVHMLSLQAFNALLKIMEEPPTYVVFILCTTEIQKVPGTIISRCERFDFKKISLVETINKLSSIVAAEKIEVDKDVLEAIAKKSGGYMRDAESLLGQVLSIGGKRIKKEQAELILPPVNDREALSLIEHLIKKDAAKALILLNKLSDSGINMKTFASELINISRRLLIDKISPGLSDSLGLDLGESLEKDLLKLNQDLNEKDIVFFMKKFIAASSDNRSQNIPQLPLEIAIAEICFSSLVDSDSLERERISNYKKPVLSSSSNPIEVLKKDNNYLEKEEEIKKESIPVLNQELEKMELKNLSLEEVYSKWPEFLVKIKNYNHSLSFVLQSCRPGEIKDNSICLSFKYKFHQNRVNELDIKTIVKSVLAEVYGPGLNFNTEIDENLNIGGNGDFVADNDQQKTIEKEEPKEAVLNNLLNAFGGEIVN